MTMENSAGLGVYNTYGPRATNEARSSEVHAGGALHEYRAAFRGRDYDKVTHIIPANSQIVDCSVRVKEAFNLGGTSPTIAVGTSGSAATDGVSISEAQAEAVGFYDITPSGTWASPLTADTTVAVELGGTSPTIGDGGEVEFAIRYVRL